MELKIEWHDYIVGRLGGDETVQNVFFARLGE